MHVNLDFPLRVKLLIKLTRPLIFNHLERRIHLNASLGNGYHFCKMIVQFR